MALTQITTSGLANGAVTSDKISNSVQLGGPTISQIQITDSSYNVLDDTAVSTSGGYIKITGTGFAAGAIVVIGSVNATSTGFVSSTVLNVQVPALSAGTYTVYVVNSNGGTAIGVNGLTYSAEPNWVTGSTLPNGSSGSAISIQLDATEATTYTLQAGSSLPDGLTLTSGGLLSGTITVGVETVYSFTVVATDAQAQDSPRAFTITITSGDPYFYLTTLLLPGNGTNNGTNNTFLDSSTNNFTITRNGNTTQGAFTPFSQTGWSNYFDGSGDYLTIPNNVAFDFGTDDFTVECWIYKSASSAEGCFLGGTTTGSFDFVYYQDSLRFGRYNTAWDNTFSYTLSSNAWNHVVFIKQSGNAKVYVNGTLIGSQTNSISYNTQGGSVRVNVSGDGSRQFNAYISNLRVVKGTAVYTGAFTPPASPLTAISGTSLLTCQSNRFLDNSTNNFTIAVNGNTSIQSFSPFNPTSSYSTSTIGGSAYFDGTGDYLTWLGTTLSGDFTLECWVYKTAVDASGYTNVFSGSNGNHQLAIDQITPGSISLVIGAATIISPSGTAVTPYAWHHLAWVREGSNCRVYVDGVQQGTGSSSASFAVGTIGRFYDGGYEMNGYISGVRIIAGTCLYPNGTTFTPPTAPPANIANTALLCNFTNGQITDATSKNVLETVGDAKISTAQSKFGGSSMYFDGTGDFLTIPDNINLRMGTGSFTIEFWWYPVSITGYQSPIDKGYTGAGALLWQTGNGDGRLIIYASGSAVITSNTAVSTNTWTHVALVRNSSTMTLYQNGNSVGSVSNSTDFSDANIMGIGSNATGAGGVRFVINGYLDDLRITKGYARYTTNFTPPTSAFQTQ